MTDFTTPGRVIVTCDFPNFTSQTFKSMDAVRKGGTATPYYDGGSTTPDLLSGAAEFGTAVKLSRGFNAARDMPLFMYLDPLVMNLFFTVTKKLADPQLRANGGTFIYTVLLTGLTDLAALTGPGTEPATLDLDVTVQSRRAV